MTESNPQAESKRVRFVQRFGIAIILLMMALMIMPYNITTQSLLGEGGSGPVVATMGERDIRAGAIMQARDRFEALKDIHFRVPIGQLNDEWIPLPTIWGAETERLFSQQPEAYFVALEEARAVTGGVSLSQLEELSAGSYAIEGTTLSRLIGQQVPVQFVPIDVAVARRENNRIVYIPVEQLPELDRNRYRALLADFLQIEMASSMGRTVAKASTPLIDRFIAQTGQQIDVRLVQFDATSYRDSVPAPTRDQLLELLNTYDDVAPEAIDIRVNPLRLSYRLPNRVKLQTITIDRSAVRAKVEAGKTAYEWEVEAGKAYLADPAAFAPRDLSNVTTAPTTRPFEEVKPQAIARVIDDATDQQVRAIESRIRRRMVDDFQKLRAQTTRPTSMPTTLGPDFMSFAYLSAIAADVQRAFGVLPVVASYEDRFRGTEDLASIPELSDLFSRELPPQSSRLADYAVELARPFLEDRLAERLGDMPIELFEPSLTLRSFAGDRVAIARVTATASAEPATPDMLDALTPRLTQDWIKLRSLELARAEANALVERLRAGEPLSQATLRPILPVTTLSARTPAPPDLRFSEIEAAQFYDSAVRALLDTGLTGAEPVAVVDAALAGDVFVAQRLAVRGTWPADVSLQELRAELRPAAENSIVDRGASGAAQAAWFDRDELFARNSFVARDDN